MSNRPNLCPKCSENTESWNGKGLWSIKKGYYKTKHNGQYVPRYQCKRCRHVFSSRSLQPNYRHKKPALNKLIYKWYSSGTTQRRIAINLGINRKTVARKFYYLASLARKAHKYRIESNQLKTAHVQFDELESYEHTLMKPISISIAVDTFTGHIITMEAASMKSHGKLIGMSKDKYGYREDTRDAAREDAFLVLQKVQLPGMKIITDMNPSYLTFRERFLPYVEMIQVKSKGGIKLAKLVRRNKEDDLWRVNHVCAKLRNDLSRLARKSWVTTKKMWALQAHLDLYVAYNNGYELF